MNTPLVFLDAGHGGIHPETQKYTTKGKLFFHESHEFYHEHNPNLFCEGIWNRKVANLLQKRLEKFGVKVVQVAHEHEDTSLFHRVRKANKLDNRNCVYLSLHANAANQKARGFMVFTSKGNTKSDTYASLISSAADIRLAEKFKNKGFYVRKDVSDGDADHEEQFYVLRKTQMPAVLLEPDFFDDLEGAKLLDSAEFIDAYVALLCQTLLYSFNSNFFKR